MAEQTTLAGERERPLPDIDELIFGDESRQRVSDR